MTDILTDQGLIDYVSGSLPRPQHTFNATGDIVDPQGTQAQAIQAWDCKDRQALSQIRLRVSDDPLVYITDTTTSLCAWQTLADTYQPKGVIAIVLLRRQLSRLRLPTRVKVQGLTGFIGRGNSKNVVYARIGNNEYALGKAHDESLSVAEHAKMLRDEITNMYLGEHIRTQFFEFVSDVDATVPSFEFHVEGAIIGVLEPLDPGHISATLALPFQYFIATSYLPCGPSEKAIQKFTGNADCGNPPGTDALTAAIHPFYDWMYDRQGTMKLIDPQSHSSETNSNLRMYWDGGPKAIQHFLDHHLKSCGQNYVCNKLDMQTLEMDWDNPRPATPTGSEDFARGRSRALLLSPHQFRNKKPRPHQHHLFVLVLFALGSYSAAPLVDTFML
ncbi:hypothetical protein K438DRAFT_2085717 [Mycena galopus ATCC 62051]|nr:hypothetical protein K438DRAFT_2085717 [Mycena galopus ATCC 62051]